MPSQLRSEPFMQHALNTWGANVYRLALAHTRSDADAQDIVQEVFLSLLKSTVSFRDDEHEKAWLLHVAVNHCRQHHRSAWKRRVEVTETMDQLADSVFNDPDLEALFKHPVWFELANLPEKLRIVVHLHDVEGYSTGDIAEILDVLPATVRTRLHRARKQLRSRLDPTIETLPTEKGATSESRFV